METIETADIYHKFWEELIDNIKSTVANKVSEQASIVIWQSPLLHNNFRSGSWGDRVIDDEIFIYSA